MSGIHLTITATQRDLLLRMLRDADRKKRVEVRRTEFSHAMRDELEEEERQLQELIDMLLHVEMV